MKNDNRIAFDVRKIIVRVAHGETIFADALELERYILSLLDDIDTRDGKINELKRSCGKGTEK